MPELATSEPLTVTITEAARLSNLSRATLYRRAAERKISFVKSGTRTLIPFGSLKHYLDSLPAAVIRPVNI